MSEGLYLPSRLVEELAEEKFRAANQREQHNAIVFHDTTLRIGGLPGSSGTAFGEADLLKEVKGWIAIGVRAISDRLSGLSVAAHIRVDDEDDPMLPIVHPSNQILLNPNPVFSMPLMLGLMGAWIKLTGNAYFQVLHDGLGVPRELWPMPPDRVFPVPSSTDVIGGYVVISANGEERSLEAREVVRVWRPDPSRIYQAQGDLAPQADEYNAERFRVGHVKNTFENDATPRSVLEMQSDAPAPQQGELEAWRTTWKELNHRRKGRNQGVPAILPPGFKIHEMGQNADGAATAVLGDKARDQLLAAMGVPASIVGLVVDVNRAAAETNHFTFDRNTVKPLADLFAGALTQQLAPQFDSQIVYKFAEFVSPDKDFDLSREQSDLDRKVITINEVRKKRNRDEVEWGSMPVGSFSDTPYTGDEDFGSESVMDLSDVPRVSPARANDRAAHVTDSIRDASSPQHTWRRMVANERKFVSRLTRAMGKVFAAQTEVVIERLRKAMPEPRVRVSAEDLFVDGEFDALYSVEVQRLRETIYLENGVASFGITDPAGEFVFSEVQRLRLDQIHADMVTRVDQHTKNLISRALVEGTGKGESVGQLAARMRPAISNRKRARTIARTEVGKAAQLAQLESFAQSTVVERKQWNTSLDGDVRDSHIAAEGQIVGLEELFTLGSGSVATVPLDPALPAEDIVNCRCFMTPVFVDDEGS